MKSRNRIKRIALANLLFQFRRDDLRLIAKEMKISQQGRKDELAYRIADLKNREKLEEVLYPHKPITIRLDRRSQYMNREYISTILRRRSIETEIRL